MAISVSQPLSAPTGLTATLKSGGSLAPSTTYYFIVLAWNTESPNILNTGNPDTVLRYHSPISAEGSFTTDTTNLSALITWTNSAEHTANTRYNIIITTTSGSYAGMRLVAPSTTDLENVGAIADGTTGYTVTAVPAGTSLYARAVYHSVQLTNNLPFNLSKDTGVIRIDLSGTNAHTIKGIYDAVVAAGYSNNVYYDGYNFGLKGYIVVNATNDAGSLIVQSKNLVFIRGGVIIYNSPNFVVQFGDWISDEVGADYSKACSLTFLSCRYPNWAYYTTDIYRIYGGRLNGADSAYYTTGEPLYNSAYTSYSLNTAARNVANFKDVQLGGTIRADSSNIYDLKYSQSNNYSIFKRYRCTLLDAANLPYDDAGTGDFYKCDYRGTYLTCYNFRDGGYDNCQFYDCDFNGANYTDNMVDPAEAQCMRVGNMSADYLTTNNHYEFFYTVKIKVVNEEGDALSGATIKAVDKDGNAATWCEKDGTTDETVSGTEYTSDRTSDTDGEIDYYLQSYGLTHDNTITAGDLIAGVSWNWIKTNKYPYTITISKTGYETAIVPITKLNKAQDLTIALKPATIQLDQEMAIQI